MALHRLGVERDRRAGTGRPSRDPGVVAAGQDVDRHRGSAAAAAALRQLGAADLRDGRRAGRAAGSPAGSIGLGGGGLVVRGVPGGHEVGGQQGGDLLLLAAVGWGVGRTGLVEQRRAVGRLEHGRPQRLGGDRRGNRNGAGGLLLGGTGRRRHRPHRRVRGTAARPAAAGKAEPTLLGRDDPFLAQLGARLGLDVQPAQLGDPLRDVERPAAVHGALGGRPSRPSAAIPAPGDVSGTRVRLREGPLEPVDGDVGVDLGGRERRVPE